MDRGAGIRAANGRITGPFDASCPYPRDERRKLSAETQQKQETSGRTIIPAVTGLPSFCRERAVEMAALWKAWKAKSRLPHSFHQPLGNLAKGGRDSHISTAPATRADGKVENQKQVFHFPTAPSFSLTKKKTKRRAGFAPRAAAALRARPKKSEGNCR